MDDTSHTLAWCYSHSIRAQLQKNSLHLDFFAHFNIKWNSCFAHCEKEPLKLKQLKSTPKEWEFYGQYQIFVFHEHWSKSEQTRVTTWKCLHRYWSHWTTVSHRIQTRPVLSQMLGPFQFCVGTRRIHFMTWKLNISPASVWGTQGVTNKSLPWRTA